MHMSSQPSIYSDSDDDEEVDSEAGITPRELSTFLRGLGSDPLGLLAATSEEAGADQLCLEGPDLAALALACEAMPPLMETLATVGEGLEDFLPSVIPPVCCTHNCLRKLYFGRSVTAESGECAPDLASWSPAGTIFS